MRRIIALYDTFLGRFKFFRRLIDVLIDFHNDMDELRLVDSSMDKTLEEIKVLLADMRIEFDALKERVDELSTATSPELGTSKNPRDIIQRLYDAHNIEPKS